ncbi:MAG: hypothetical protein K0S34_105 [Bacillales bacterium]|jgi:hypothetical protein|nr:hypothetical protein [Bacillales bacterium]
MQHHISDENVLIILNELKDKHEEINEQLNNQIFDYKKKLDKYVYEYRFYYDAETYLYNKKHRELLNNKYLNKHDVNEEAKLKDTIAKLTVEKDLNENILNIIKENLNKFSN